MAKGNSHWEVATLGDICRRGGGFIQTGPFGSQLHASDYVEDGIPTIMPKNIGENKVNEDDLSRVAPSDVERLRKYKVQTGDIVYSRRGDVTLRALIREQQNGWLCGTGSLMIRLGKGIVDPKFVSYYLGTSNAREWIQNHAVGATMPNLNTSIMSAAPIAHPPLLEQQKIAAVLSALDAKIELNQRINAELESMAKTLYDYWFVQFDFPNEKGKPYKSTGGKMVWNEELKREIPLGWEADALGNHIKINRGVSYQSTDLKDSGIPMVNLNSFYLNGRYKPEGIKHLIDSFKVNKEIKAGDLLIAATDVTRNAFIIGKSFILPDLYAGQVVASSDVGQIEVGSKLDKHYLDMLFNSDDYHRYIKGFASGTLVLHLNTKGIEWYKTILPPKDLLNKFSQIKHNIEKKKTIIIKESQTLTELRDWLLPMLMNGQVKVG